MRLQEHRRGDGQPVRPRRSAAHAEAGAVRERIAMTSLFRRRLVVAGFALPFSGSALAQPLTCGTTTPSETAGPFFKPESPLRASLIEKSSASRKLVVSGIVL